MSETPDHVIQSALEWRKEQAKRAKAEEKPRAKANGQVEPLAIEPLSALADQPVPERRFLDSGHLLPMKNVSLLGGDGGTGKSLLALQLSIACDTGTPWLGMEIEPGPVLFMSAEDDRDEIHKRAAEICAADGLSLAEAFRANMIYRAGMDAVMAVEKDGLLVPTPFFASLTATLEWVQPILLILDNLADVFGGNENSRTQAKQFVGMLRGLAICFDCVVLLLGHPSLSGLASGTGTSGSTAWNNSVRSRLYLHEPEGNEGEIKDKDARILECKKANYAAAGQRLELKWADGRFLRSAAKSAFDRIAVADVDRVREKFAATRYRVNEQAVDWGGYAVAELLDWDVGRGIGAKERNAEQNRNRTHIRIYLAGWVRNRVIHVINGFTSKREPAQFYSDKEE
jgi:hypothetical protein